MKTAFPLGRSLLLAALMIGISALLSWLAPAHISTELSHRLLGALLGAMVVAYANAIPKALAARTRCAPAAQQAARRFAGWILVLGGFGNMLAWLLVPIGAANLTASLILASSLLLAVLRCVRIRADTTPT